MTWKLLLVLGLAVLAARAVRWLSSPGLAPDSLLRVLARLPVGPQQTLILVVVGKKRLLVGQSSQQLTLLTELAEEDLVITSEDRPSQTGRAWRQRNPFDGFLSSLVPHCRACGRFGKKRERFATQGDFSVIESQRSPRGCATSTASRVGEE